MFWGLCAWVLAQSGASNRVMAVWLWWVVMRGVPRGRVHRSKVWSLLPIKIMFPFYLTTQVVLLKVTSHPTSVKTRMPNKDAIERLGIMCPVNGKGRPLMYMLHICVNKTWQPSTSDTVREFVVALLLITGVPSITNICIAPESAIALPVLRGNVALGLLANLKETCKVLSRCWVEVTSITR